jgi:hypothetical protein
MPKLSTKLETKVMRGRDMARLAESIGKFIAERIAPLEQRIATIEQRPVPKYVGVWKRETVYPAGSFVTHHGSTWHANISAEGIEPGSGSTTWTLTAKRGRDRR